MEVLYYYQNTSNYAQHTVRPNDIKTSLEQRKGYCRAMQDQWFMP